MKHGVRMNMDFDASMDFEMGEHKYEPKMSTQG